MADQHAAKAIEAAGEALVQDVIDTVSALLAEL